MHDRQQIEELSGAVSIGLLAEETVLATARVLRGINLNQRDKEALLTARKLLQRLGATPTGVMSPPGPKRMDSEEAYLDTLRAVRLQAPNEPLHGYLTKLAKVLSKAAGGKTLSSSDRQLVTSVRDLFIHVGELTLARAAELFDRSSQDPLSWIQIQTTSPS